MEIVESSKVTEEFSLREYLGEDIWQLIFKYRRELILKEKETFNFQRNIWIRQHKEKFNPIDQVGLLDTTNVHVSLLHVTKKLLDNPPMGWCPNCKKFANPKITFEYRYCPITFGRRTTHWRYDPKRCIDCKPSNIPLYGVYFNLMISEYLRLIYKDLARCSRL